MSDQDDELGLLDPMGRASRRHGGRGTLVGVDPTRGRR